MTDPDLDKLKAALKATPAPDKSVKAEHIAWAEKKFDSHQETAGTARPIHDRHDQAGAKKGLKAMFDKLTTRGVLTATTSLAAIGLIAVVIWPEGGMDDITDIGGRPTETTEAPTPASTGDPQPVDQAAPEIEPEQGTTPAVREAPELADSNGAATSNLMDSAPDEDLAIAEAEADFAAPAEPVPAPMVTAPSSEARSALGGIVSMDAEEMIIIDGRVRVPEANTEEYANEAPNPLKITSEEPVSTFSIDVDTASYSVIRNSLMNGYLPPSEAVRIEEMINYFSYDYPAPDGAHPFQQSVTVTDTPWNDGTQLVHIGIQGELPVVEDRPPLNLVFLIDTSGSMDNANKLPLLIQSLRLMLSELRPEDQVAIVTYAGSAGLVLEPTPAGERATILNALERLRAGGSTAGQAGLQQAYQVAEDMMDEGEISRVLLATDGDFNVGIYDPADLETYISDKRDSGVYLSVLGFGRGNLDDATMQALAQNGNGTAAYIDTLSEAQKVLVDNLTGALFPIANDVKIQIEWNPAQIAEYRLIGYETRALRREDFNNDAVDAGEIGAGHSVTAIYEVTPVGSDAIMNDALRYAQTPEDQAQTNASDELGFLKLRYKAPGEDTSTLITQPITPDMGTANADTRFAAAIAGWGQLLRGSDYLVDWGYGDLIALATQAQGADRFGYRREAVTLMRLAQSLSEN